MERAADLDMAVAVVVNAKVQRPGTCNIFHRPVFIKKIRLWGQFRGIRGRGQPRGTRKIGR